MFNSSPQALAAAAMAHLPDLPDPSILHAAPAPLSAYKTACPSDGNGSSGENTLRVALDRAVTPPWQRLNMPDAGAAPNLQGDSSILSQTTSLPSLFRYVDNDLLRVRAVHNRPTNPNAVCHPCIASVNKAIIPSTFVPLTPCGCWMHYRCFVFHVTRAIPNRDRCPTCGIKLFNWEGIAALTLATRTNIEMENVHFSWDQSYADPLTGHKVTSDESAYISDCALIDSLIVKHFFEQVNASLPPERSSRFPDKSPDLSASYYGVLEDLDKVGRPHAKWLSFNPTDADNDRVGFSLFGMLVALKMRRYLVEQQPGIRSTDAWAAFENSREELQRMILKEVKGEKWSCVA
ncbi:hypothetical protein N0V90_008462 [Kalmusia sp. IMI 367209]|nr:hypothetical protein N0V90_008462 [Kalmusia sp. IMI 367209]